MMASDDQDHQHHVVLFPFMSKGHIIPILHLARLLVSRNSAVTVFTTPANRPFISQSLSDTRNISIEILPFPDNIDYGGTVVPPGIECTDKLPDMSLWLPFLMSTQLMKPDFERALETLPGRPVTFMVTDAFLAWTLHSANKYGIPRLVYYGMSNFATTVFRIVTTSGLPLESRSNDEPFPIPHFPWVKLTRNDFEPPFSDSPTIGGPHFDFVMDSIVSVFNSAGQVVNSFYELEPVYAEYWNNNFAQKLWSVGPLCLFEPPRARAGDDARSTWMKWLDGMLEEGKEVLYVAFGSQAEISGDQFEEIKIGLEKSQVNFVWVVRKKEAELQGFEERVKNRGLVVKEWVDQKEILGHESIQGFLSHCGWNSVVESICAKVPILAWPMMAEQPLNARLVVEEIKVGIKVETCNGSVKGFVKAESLEKSVRDLMEGELGKEMRKKVKEVGEAAGRAVQEGGSSWKALDELLRVMHACKETHV